MHKVSFRVLKDIQLSQESYPFGYHKDYIKGSIPSLL
jgi:hypothetical protein